MDWLSALDLAAFRSVNQTIANPVLDVVMPFLTGNRFSLPIVVLGIVWLLAKCGSRGRAFVLVAAVALLLGDSVAVRPLKKAVGRARPYVDHPETRLLVGQGNPLGSFPSGHSANAAAVAAVAVLFYRRSWRFAVPLAVGVGVSRVYNGAHHPLDVLAGWGFGALAGIGATYGTEALWRSLGRWMFPLWWGRLPSLRGDPVPAGREDPADLGRHWIRAGYLLIGVLLVVRLLYLRAAVIELSEDEAYQWIWSKHLALSYYSKPPGIAVAQWIGTSLFGDTELGVRFLSPVFAAVLGLMLLRFVATHADARTAFLFVLMVTAAPLLSVGSVLMTIDPLLVLFWTAAMMSGWKAITEDSTKQWLWTGLWWGGAFLSKYSSPFLWASVALFFVIWPPARIRLRRPGPWLALLVNLACTLPVLLWNQQHGWITVTHLGERGGLAQEWHPTLRFFGDLVGAVWGLLNPVLVVAAGIACFRFWREPATGSRGASASRPMLLRYLFCLGAPVFIFYIALTFRARVLPNWIVPGVLPLALLGAFYWHARAAAGSTAPRKFVTYALCLGLPVVVLLHDTQLIGKATGWQLPRKIDPLNRVRGYHQLAPQVAAARAKMEKEDGKPVYIITDHYGRAGMLSFYIPEAKRAVGTARPMVTVKATRHPENQFWFWPEYDHRDRRSENALYVLETDEHQPVPPQLLAEFEQVAEIGTVHDDPDPSRAWRHFQLFACRGKR